MGQKDDVKVQQAARLMFRVIARAPQPHREAQNVDRNAAKTRHTKLRLVELK